MSICIVTAFLDINRGKWASFKRTFGDYVVNFFPYIARNEDIIVFIDSQHYESIRIICQKRPNMKVISIDREWMKTNIYAYQQLGFEEAIMASPKFQKLVAHRLSHPECSKPEYNIMQHAKIDFINYVIDNKLSSATHYAWSDFGYFQNPDVASIQPLSLDTFDENVINMCGVEPLQKGDSNILKMLTEAPTRVGGGFYLGNVKALKEYQELYHSVTRDFYRMGIVDDDQHIMIQCAFRNKNLVSIWNMGDWFKAYHVFSKDEISKDGTSKDEI